VVRDLIGWLTTSKKKGKASRSPKTNLRIVSRKLSREQRKLESKTKGTEQKITDALRRGDMASAKMYTKDLVRTRKWVRNYHSLNSKIETLVMRLDRAEAMQSLASEMKNVTSTLEQVSKTIGMADMSGVIDDLEASIMEIDDVGDTLDESMESMFEDDVDDSEVYQVLADIGEQIGVSAGSDLPTPLVSGTVKDQTVDNLEDEIARLRRSE